MASIFFQKGVAMNLNKINDPEVEFHECSYPKNKTCHDCGVEEGEIHKYGCDMERCPFCGGQLITCSCKYKKLGFSYSSNHPTCGLPKKVYEKGLSEEETKTFIEILESKGRIPYIRYPNICIRCGKLWPEMFNVSDEEWEKYIEPNMRDEMLCWECYSFIKNVIDSANSRKELI